MAAEPAHGPGQDEDPARRAPEPGAREPLPPPPGPPGAAQAPATGPACKAHVPVTGRAGDAPLAADCVPSGEVPLREVSTPAVDMPLPGATPDWLDDAGWAAIVAAREDEEEPADPCLEDPPPDWDELDAAVAEAGEITAAEARDREYAARMVFCGGWGAVGAAPGAGGRGSPGRRRRSPASTPARSRGSGPGSRWIRRRAARCWESSPMRWRARMTVTRVRPTMRSSG